MHVLDLSNEILNIHFCQAGKKKVPKNFFFNFLVDLSRIDDKNLR